MDVTRLTVEFVESIQAVARKGRPTGDIVAGLKTATLPGLVEYGCLRYQQSQLPPLPETIGRTLIGQAALEVRSALGLRSDGLPKQPVRNLSARPVEFHALPAAGDLDDDTEWSRFCHRFERGSMQEGFTNDAACNLHSALFEMAENVLNHANSRQAIAGYEVRDGMAIFSVADVGVGVMKSLKSAAGFSHLREDVDAIQLALKTGVTCKTDETGGFGFNSVFKALAEQWGQLRFRSGTGCVTMDGTYLDVDRSRRHFPLQMPGFQVSVCCRTGDSAPLQLPF